MIGDEGGKAMAEALRVNGSLKLKRPVVHQDLEKHADLISACKLKGVDLIVV